MLTGEIESIKIGRSRRIPLDALTDFIDRMRERLSETLGISINQVSVKASTSDKLGFVGRGEGIAALAIALIEGGKEEGI